eukprot:6003417-Pyramimonas_sp.AAC.1
MRKALSIGATGEGQILVPQERPDRWEHTRNTSDWSHSCSLLQELPRAPWSLAGLLLPPGAAWGLSGPLGASRDLLGPPGASWGLLVPPRAP